MWDMGLGGLPRPEDLVRMVGLGRFQVMALLQAARYYILHKDLEKAKSWGLNRAIFYAWAKHYGPRYRAFSMTVEELLKRVERHKPGTKCPEGFIEVLGECVQVSPRGWFMIGGQEQTPVDFDREVVAKVRKVLDWNLVWRKALEYVNLFPEWVLRDPQRFFKLVYEPVRDTFFVKLLKGEEVKPPKTIMEKLEALEKASRKGKQLSLDMFGVRKGESGKT
jgi:hypothetical protein